MFQSYPYLVVKTRLQMKGTATGAPLYSSTSQALATIWKEEGIAGFFSGVSSKLLHSVLTAAILFLLKEEFVTYTVKLLVLVGLLKKVK
jgi:adenine nucleotide transporter 17